MKYLFTFTIAFFLFSNLAIAKQADIIYDQSPSFHTDDPQVSLTDFSNSNLHSESIYSNYFTPPLEETCRVKMKGSFNGLEFDFWVEINMPCKDFWGQFLDTFFDKM